jgi:hypothetical protein
MILVLAHARDLPARHLVDAWHCHGARLVTLADLSRAGWRTYLGDAGPEVAVASGEVLPAAAITGVLTRIPWITPEDLPHVVEGDRAYVAAEICAFLIAWLSQRTCPVINRPATNSLMGAPHAGEGWVVLAARAGLRPPWARRAFPAPPEPPWPPAAVTVSVLGERCFGDVDPALADQACRLAALAGVELLSVTFSDPGADATFLGAHLWPDVSEPELAAALLARLAPAPAVMAARPTALASEVRE